MYYLLRPYQNSSFIKLISLLIISFSFVQTALAKEHETIVIDNVRHYLESSDYVAKFRNA